MGFKATFHEKAYGIFFLATTFGGSKMRTGVNIFYMMQNVDLGVLQCRLSAFTSVKKIMRSLGK